MEVRICLHHKLLNAIHGKNPEVGVKVSVLSSEDETLQSQADYAKRWYSNFCVKEDALTGEIFDHAKHPGYQ